MKHTIKSVLAESHALIKRLDEIRPDVPAERLPAFEHEYAQAVELRDSLAVRIIEKGLEQRLESVRSK